MTSRRIQSIQDPVHGLMEFQGMETAIVEVLRARELQRLRRLNQLGLAHLVYPGAEHSRLVHSIGVAYLAVRFARRIAETSRGFLCSALLPTDSAVRDIGLAALVHDLGHGPFSHTWENDILGEMKPSVRASWCKALNLESDEVYNKLKWHELATQGLLAWEDGELYKCLERQETGTSERIRNLLLGRYYLPYLPTLISSDLDADRCDFMLRDSFMTGVPYGKYDLEWIVSNVRLGVHNHNKLVIGFESKKTLRAVEEFILARRAMYDVVYYHRTVKSAESMLGLIMSRLKDLGKLGSLPDFLTQQPFTSFGKFVSGQMLQPHELLLMDDSLMWTLIQRLADSNCIDNIAADLSKRLLNRSLLKAVPCKSEKINKFLLDKDAHAKIEEVLRPMFPDGRSKYYYQLVSCPINLLSDKQQDYVYFVDSNHSSRPTSPVRDHQLLRTWVNQPPTVFLFAPEEARDVLLRLIQE